MKHIQHIIILGLILVMTSGCAQKVAVAKKNPFRSYTVFGKKYYPMEKVSPGFAHTGVASWYGPGFHGRKTASGEVYDMYNMTAAHSILPLNTMVKVTNLSNQKEIVVRVNDRGPFVGDRVIDLSLAAARKLGMAERGISPVRVAVLGPAKTVIASKTRGAKAEKKPEKQENPYFARTKGWLALLSGP